jgi:hypothetical protein
MKLYTVFYIMSILLAVPAFVLFALEFVDIALIPFAAAVLCLLVGFYLEGRPPAHK